MSVDRLDPEVSAAIARFKEQNGVENIAVVVDHEGTILPEAFLAEVSNLFNDSAAKHRIRHLPINEPLLNVLRTIAADPDTFVVSGSNVDTVPNVIGTLPPVFEQGLNKGHSVLRHAAGGELSFPTEPIPPDTALVFINNQPHAVMGLIESMSGLQPHFDTLIGVRAIIPNFTGNCDDPTYHQEVKQSVLSALDNPALSLRDLTL